MELLFFLISILALIWGFNKFGTSKKHTKADRSIAKEGADTKALGIESRKSTTTYAKKNGGRRSIESRARTINPPEPSLEENSSLDQSVDFFADDDLHQMLVAISKFRAVEIFSSISTDDKKSIRRQLKKCSDSRELDRYSRLELAEFEKQKTINEFDAIEFAIAENDDWFVAAKNGDVDVTSETLRQRKRKAEELYSRKRTIIDSLLPEADSKIKKIVSQIESDEAQEMLFQRRDLERLLLPFHEERERARRHAIVAQAKEAMRQREEEEARRQKEYATLKNRLRAEDLERSRLLAEDRQKKRVEGIRAEVDARKIPYLVHFTPIANLPSIVESGLLSRNDLTGKSFIHTDEYRTDGWLDWISTSISFPNYKMFYSKQNSLKDVDGWAVLLIQRDVLWELDCKYIVTNAASSGIRMFTDSRWSSIEAFADMFGSSEHRNNIPQYYTTDPQAEVMIHKEVPLRYIEEIVVRNKNERDRLSNLNGISVKISPQLFSYRSDFEHWRQFRLSAFSDNNSKFSPF